MPNVSVVIAGANPPADIKNIAERNKEIAVTGYVEDILEVYSKSKVFIAPIRYGTGMRLKILEAMALGIPVVSTSIGARGISGNSIAIADTSQEFGSKVIKLLWNSDNYGNLSREARTTIEKFYNWKLISDKYENIYYELITQYGKKV